MDESFLEKAGPGEPCFVEDRSVAPFAGRVERVVLYRWDRAYPADLYWDLSLEGWTLARAGGVPRLLPRDHYKGSLYPMNRTRISLTAALLSLCLLLSGCMMPPAEGTVTSFSLEDIPAWSGEPYVAVDGNQRIFRRRT